MAIERMRASQLVERGRVVLQKARSTFQNRRIQWIGAIVCFLLVNGYIAYRLYKDWGEIQSLGWEWLRPDAGLLGLTALVQFIGLLTALYSWTYTMSRFGYHIGFRRHFKIYTLSNLARKIPGVGWDILSRVYMYQQDGGNKVQVSVTAVSEMVIFGVASALVTLITMLLPGSLTGYINPWLLIGLLALFLGLIPSPLFRRFLAWLNSHSPTGEHLRWYHLMIWMGLNTITTVLGGVGLFLFCQAFGFGDSIALVPMIQGWSLALVSGALLFWLPADIGVTSGIIVVVLSTMMPLPQAVIILVAWRIWNTLNELVWGGIGFSL